QQLDDFIAATEVLGVPCYVAYGNHELRSAECLQVLEQRIGPIYFAFSHGNSRFYVLNTYIPGETGRITGEQLAWLRADLAAEGAQAAHRFVFFHAPMFSPMNDMGKRKWGDPENLQELQRLFADSDVDAVFNGHDH
ncbi:MAG: metallophosphoesterase, partial [Armatimonadota bacterium]